MPVTVSVPPTEKLYVPVELVVPVVDDGVVVKFSVFDPLVIVPVVVVIESCARGHR